jgi:hypothetical protein
MLKAPFDPVQLAIPFFVLAVILELLLGRFGKAKANYETRDTAMSLSMGLGSTIAGACSAAWSSPRRSGSISTGSSRSR